MSKRDGKAIPFKETVAELTVFCASRAEAAALFDVLDQELAGVKAHLPLSTPLWMRGEAQNVPPHQLDMKHSVMPKRSGRLCCTTIVFADRSRLRPSEPPPPTLRAIPRP